MKLLQVQEYDKREYGSGVPDKSKYIFILSDYETTRGGYHSYRSILHLDDNYTAWCYCQPENSKVILEEIE